MTLFAFLLVLFSALLHAGWNLIGKSNQGSGSAFFLASALAPALLLTPFIVWFLVSASSADWPVEFMMLVLLSGVCQAVYLLGLANAYQQADIGVIYPIARAMPVLMVGFGTYLLGQNLDVHQWVGFSLLTVGCLLVPLTNFKQLNWSSYFNLGVLWAVVAAIGTTGYSIIDKQAIDLLNITVAGMHSSVSSAVFYLAVQFWSMVLSLVIWLMIKRDNIAFSQAWQIRKKGAIAGVMMGGTYALVLYAMSMTENVSLVVALRQVSIVFGLAMGVLILKEKWYATRGVGVGLIVLGLITALS
ncbi:EamA family transporter [Vibrio tapetis subsp. quintayensis]|uniref:EamA family transporter n=1 Tax=Vibrio tapetis TaxID=52443 RepID=UPI0025B4E177|nr:EamA family transporter [Vibrio tapetis]MDN3681975.1 EamA family transporter [Vibrio tapetis subsp. quintayensis]